MLIALDEFYSSNRLITDPCGSHQRALYRAVLATQGDHRPVLELGMGDASTPLLHHCCAEMGRRLYSIENNRGWRARFAYFAADFHVLPDVSSKDFPIEDFQWSVALVDHAPAEARYLDLERLANCCEIIVIHDIGTDCWPLSTLKERFKYAAEDPARCRYPPTGIVSNTFDVSAWTFP